MGIISLEETCLVKLAVMFATRKDMEKHLMKQKNGIVQVEKGLRDLKNSVFLLPLAVNVKNRLIQTMERVLYEIFVFTERSRLNSPEVQFNLAEDIQWYPDGLINENSTYEYYFGKNPNVFLNFECLAIISAEKALRELWPDVRSETRRLKMNSLLVFYWTHNLENNLNDFIDNYGHSIVGFEPDKSVHYNMILYCLNLGFKTSLTYFFARLSVSEQRLLTNEELPLTEYSLFKKILKNPRQEHFKFICTFLEKPIMDVSVFKSITEHMPVEGVVELTNYLLRQVNCFGNLHCNLLKRIFGMLNDEVKSTVLSKLDFFVLNLLAKGHFETFEFKFKNAKDVLREQISGRLIEGKGLGLFYTICRNNQKHLLNKLILHLGENDEELLFHVKEALGESW